MAPAEDADPARASGTPATSRCGRATRRSEPETAAWPSPWGPGRPGWHIECSAMAGKYLGAAFDIHGGGVDLRFPHHENEQAQSRAAGRPFASYWLHNAWITTSGEKMSKSLGNSLLVPEVLKRVRGIELRYYMVAAHYRSTWSSPSRPSTRRPPAFRRIEGVPRAGARTCSATRSPAAPRARSWRRWTTTSARRPRWRRLRLGARGQQAARRGRTGGLRAVRGRGACDARRARARPGRPGLGASGADDEADRQAVDVLVTGLLEQRAQARAAKDWASADAIRDRIMAAGIEVEDTPDGPKWTPVSRARWQLRSAAVRMQAHRQGQPDRRLRRPGPPRPRGQGADAEGHRPALPQGLQGRRRRREGRHHPAAQASARGPATPSGSPAATPSWRRCGRSMPGDGGVRRRGCRARRPAA